MPKSSVSTGEGKARQRERNAATSAALGIPTRHAGSSGISSLMQGVGKRTWADIEDVAVHSVDIAGHISSYQMQGNRQGAAYLVVPFEYIHELLQAAIDTTTHYAFIRIYTVPRPVMHEFGTYGNEEWTLEGAEAATEKAANRDA